jgi:mannose-6-phosphate isomerase-like protein (cupin superfamily)
MKIYGTLLVLAVGLVPAFGADKKVDYYSASQLQELSKKLSTEQKTNGLVTRQLDKYQNDWTLLVYRDTSGTAEMHAHASDFYVVVAGNGTLVTGGTMVDSKTVREGEFMGKSVKGGHSQQLNPGDVVHIQPNTPHQILMQPGHTLSYFVLKVKE